jgi:hypothetical protein
MWQCDNCGFRINGGSTSHERRHECHPHGIARVQAARIDESLAEFLDTPAGRFEVLYARRRLARG